MGVLLLSLSFVLLNTLSSLKSDPHKYGKSMTCDEAGTFFWEKDRFREEAIQDFYGYELNKSPMTGILNCYCKILSEELGPLLTMQTLVKSEKMLDVNGNPLEAQICY